MRLRSTLSTWLLTLIAIAGCSSTTVTTDQAYRGGKLPRPHQILVHDFAASHTDFPRWAEETKSRYVAPDTARTSEEVATGRHLGQEVATQLVAQIRDMGLPAVRATASTKSEQDDIAILGYFTSIDEGSRMKRVVLGFGAGAAELKTHVEGFRMTEQGWKQLGSGGIDAGGGGKTPGLVVPLIVTAATANPIGLAVGGAVKVGGEVTGRTTIEGSAKNTAKAIADELRAEFQKQGWI